MVYETKTLKICHKLSKEGKCNYEKFLEQKADEILFKHEHPIKWLFKKISEIFV